MVGVLICPLPKKKEKKNPQKNPAKQTNHHPKTEL